MTLDERLHAARDDYRRLGEGPLAGVPLRPEVGPGPRRPAFVFTLVAAVVVVALMVTLAWQRSGRHDPPVSVDTDTTVTVPLPDGPPVDGDSAPLVPDPAVRLEPAGPFHDGQEVELSAPSGLVHDWPNEWPVLCSSVASEPRPTTSCDRVRPLNAERGYGGVVTGSSIGSDRDTRPITIPRTVFTPLGYRDCGAPEVSCHVVVRRADGSPAASERLEFDDEPVDLESRRVEVAPGGSQGHLRVTAPTTAEDPADGSAVGAEGWLVSVCAFGEGAPPEAPEGVVWPQLTSYAGRPGLGGNCDTLDWSTSPETPLADGDTIDLDLTRELYGYGGWSDCRRQACYVLLTPLQTEAGTIIPASHRAVAAPLPLSPTTPSTPRPSMVVTEPGPHRPGEEIAVEITGLPDSDTGMIGVCRVESPMRCGYVSASIGEGPGLRRFALLGNLDGCVDDRCFLALQSGGEGLPPAIIAPLPIEG